MIVKLLKASKRWQIPSETAKIVIERDKKCIYCGCEFDDTIRAKKASWEHIINDITLNKPDNIALCCVGCNASKGTKMLNKWLASEKAKERGVSFPNYLVKEDIKK
jgi:5-methylcytosine-specific restriction endonuclease McrA